MSYSDSKHRYIALYTLVVAALIAMAIDSSFYHIMSGLQVVGAALIILPGLAFDVILMCF